MVESMNAKFLELDATNPVVPYNDIGVKSPKTISLSLPILVVSVSSVVLIEIEAYPTKPPRTTISS